MTLSNFQMITSRGRLFHIDFGHFMGVFKAFRGIKREQSRFVFTREMERLIESLGAGEMERFRELCSRAFQTLRENSDVVLRLFTMMIPADLPELRHIPDMEYVREMLRLDLTVRCDIFESIICVFVISPAVHMAASTVPPIT